MLQGDFWRWTEGTVFQLEATKEWKFFFYVTWHVVNERIILLVSPEQSLVANSHAVIFGELLGRCVAFVNACEVFEHVANVNGIFFLKSRGIDLDRARKQLLVLVVPAKKVEVQCLGLHAGKYAYLLIKIIDPDLFDISVGALIFYFEQEHIAHTVHCL